MREVVLTQLVAAKRSEDGRLRDAEAWPKVRLGDVVFEVRERVSSGEVSRNEYVTTDNMVKDRGGIVEADYVPENVGLVSYKKGDVLIANIRPYLKKIWLADRSGGCSSDVVVYRPKANDLSNDYLFAALSDDSFFEYVMRKPRGTKMPRGDRDWMREYTLPLPPHFVQREIVERLEKELGAVDKMAKGFEKIAADADALFKAELKEAFEEVKRSGAETKRLGEVFRFIDYRGMTPTKTEEGVPLITAKNIRQGYMEYKERFFISDQDYASRQSRGIAHKGDILFTTEAPMGYAAIADQEVFSTGQRIITFQWPNSGNWNNRYYLFYFLSDIFQDQLRENASGATAQGIKASRLVNLSVAIPAADIQSAIVAKLDAAMEKGGKLKTAAEKGLETCAKLRKAILKEAFSSYVEATEDKE